MTTPREAARALADSLAASSIEEPTLEAEILVRFAAGLTREQFYAGACGDLARLPELAERRLAREPLAYITGEREFYGHHFAVAPEVLIPRPESELLVELALRELMNVPRAVALDVGTGSGCIACSIGLHRQNDGTTVACDIDARALALAHDNATNLGARVAFVQADLAAAVVKADVVVANLPYVASEVIPTLAPEVREWEPALALDGGCDGLAIVGRLIADCAARLKPRFLALEVDPSQAMVVAALLETGGAADVCVHRDLADRDRVVSARWSA